METTAFKNIHAWPTASSSSRTCSESSKFEEETDEDGEDKGEDVELDIEQPLAPKDVEETFHPSTLAKKADWCITFLYNICNYPRVSFGPGILILHFLLNFSEF